MKTTFWVGLGLACLASLVVMPKSGHGQDAGATLQPGPATVVAENVNVRGQPTIRSEVITRLTRGDAVVVIETIKLAKPAAGEPAVWAKIAFPTNAHVWVHAQFIDPTNKTVLPRKLNMRAGPGENYSIVGVLEQGQTVCEVLTKDNWMQIVPPANAYAFIAAQYLHQEPAQQLAAAKPAEPVTTQPAKEQVQETVPAEPGPAPVIETVTLQPEIATAPTEPAVAPAAATTPAIESVAVAPPTEEQPPPKRIVQREGIVRYSLSIQAPTPFCLVSPDTGEIINYLHTTATNLNLRRYRNLRIIVTGEEGIDKRWTNTPVLTIQRIYVVE